MTDDEYHEGIFGNPEHPMPTPEWVKLIPADSIPVFCLNENVLDQDIIRISAQLADFFGERKFLVIRSGDVQIYAIANQDKLNDND